MEINKPHESFLTDSDFTTLSYRKLIKLAKQNYSFATYEDVPWGSNFVLWRHDCDYSLNRAHALALIESEEEINSTYFLNLHCAFYNLFEPAQHKIVMDIIKMGHHIGLHFDGAFYSEFKHEDLSNFVEKEADIFESLFGIRPKAFSFHNPLPFHLSCEEEYYGGLLNCYSKRFKTEVPYCSDSNGYWRFRRLHDVLTKAEDKCIQILTHPDWWYDSPMPPRQKIFRCIYGRAEASMRAYDKILETHERQNLNGAAKSLDFLKLLDHPKHQLFDIMWMNSEFQVLFLELIRLFQTQMVSLSKVFITEKWAIRIEDVNLFFKEISIELNGSILFFEVTGELLHEIMVIKKSDLQKWLKVQHQLFHGFHTDETQDWESGCIFMCELIKKLAAWGNENIGFDGIENLPEDLINKETVANQASIKFWSQFKTKIQSGEFKKK